MSKTFALLSVIIATGFAGLAYPPVGPQAEEHVAIEALEKQRVQLLQDRVAGIKTMVDSGLAAQSELLRPEIDVINARLEYTDSDVARKKLAGELLTKYDALI